jgi:hypothetical protein
VGGRRLPRLELGVDPADLLLSLAWSVVVRWQSGLGRCAGGRRPDVAPAVTSPSAVTIPALQRRLVWSVRVSEREFGPHAADLQIHGPREIARRERPGQRLNLVSEVGLAH